MGSVQQNRTYLRRRVSKKVDSGHFRNGAGLQALCSSRSS
jgi:hypothetical protein